MIRALVSLICGFAVVLVLGGCGGGSNSATSSPGGTASATLRISWPASRIPATTNRLVIRVAGQGIAPAISYIKDKPSFGGVETVTIQVPAGPKRRFSVEARRVAAVKPEYQASAVLVKYTSSDLGVGTLLGAGTDQSTPDIAPGGSFSAAIQVSEASSGGGVTNVSLTVTQIQIEGNRWPALLALQIIRDQNGNPITGLNRANFEVFENGVACQVIDVRTGLLARNPISTSLVLDRSGSMAGDANSKLESAATAFVNLMKPDDAAQVINFSDQVKLDQDFTSDKSLLLGAIQGGFLDGTTALFDAVFLGVQSTTVQSGRRALIAMTDGQDNASTRTENQVTASATSGQVPLFMVGLGSYDQGVLTRMATQTGGQFYAAPSASDLESIYRKISGELDAQVQVDFISPDTVRSGKVRQVVVKFKYGSIVGQTTYQYVY